MSFFCLKDDFRAPSAESVAFVHQVVGDGLHTAIMKRISGWMPVSANFRPSRCHEELGPEFYDVVAPAAFPRLILRHRNDRWAERVGLGDLTDAEWLEHFGRFTPRVDLRFGGDQRRTLASA